MKAHRLLLTAALLLGVTPAVAADPAPAKKGSAQKGKPAMDLGLPTFGEIPKGEGMKGPTAEPLADTAPKVTATNAEYAVVSVKHAKGFMRGAGGAQPMGGALKEIGLTGDPPTSEKFTTVVRVKCKERLSAPIELAILDTRGDTVMSGTGEVNFRGIKADEVDYTIDWDPTPWRTGGEFQVLVRIAGQPKGTYPLKFTVR